MTAIKLRQIALGIVIALLATQELHAEPMSGEKAAAEALFQAGLELAAAGKFRDACKKFSASQQLEPALGTMLYLADCLERTGRTASAWALFQEAQSMAKVRGQSDREKIAQKRAASLEKRLSKLTLLVAEDGPPDLSIRLNGIEIPSASWGVPIPVDPGRQSIVATAPGFETWRHELVVPKGPVVKKATVPTLEAEPQPKSKSPTEPMSKPTPRPVKSAPESPTQRLLGYVAGGTGLVGLGVAGVLGYRAYTLHQNSLDHCGKQTPNACTPEGVSLRDEARTWGTGATISSIAGGALLLTGLALIWTAPSENNGTENDTPIASVQLDPSPHHRRAQLAVTGTW